MSRAFGMLLSSAGVASDVVGVPGLGVAISTLKKINDTCAMVGVHQETCQTLQYRAMALHDVLTKHEKMKDEEMRLNMKELQDDLQHILNKLNKYVQYNSFKRFTNKGKIGEGLQLSMNKLEAAIEKFRLLGNTRVDSLASQSLQETIGVVIAINRGLSIPNRERSDMQEPGRREDVMVALNGGDQEVEGEPSTALEIDHHVSTTPSPFPQAPIPEGSLLPPKSLKEDQEDIKNQHDELRLMTEAILDSFKAKGLTHHVPMVGPDNVKLECDTAVRGGLHSDVWKARYHDELVALKTLRISRPDQRAIDRFTQQVNVWAQCQDPHGNVLSLDAIYVGVLRASHDEWGVNSGRSSQSVCIVTPWLENDNVLEYVKTKPNADKLNLMLSAAVGLRHLHSHNLAHGNVKCNNILVKSDGKEALISDFGMCSADLEEDPEQQETEHGERPHESSRWKAPEVLKGGAPTPASDVYGWAMAVLECLTTKKPYSTVKRDAAVVNEVIFSRPPERPAGPGVDEWLTDDLWELLLACWSKEPEDRPTMIEVVKQLRDIRRDIKAPKKSWS